MRLDDAKAEVLERVSKIVGARVSERDLTLPQRQALTSIAETLRQLIVLKQMLMIEETKRRSLTYRVSRALFGSSREEEEEVKNHIRQIDELQKLLNKRIEELAKSIIESAEAGQAIGVVGATAHTPVKVIQPLRCTHCGARLKVISSSEAKCEYCGMSYTMATYLQMLRTSIEEAPNKQ